MAPRALSLDLDDTLWPIAPVIEHAEQALHQWLLQRHPDVAARYAPPVMRGLRDRITAQCPEIAHDFSAQRRLSLVHALRACGHDAAEAEQHAAAAFEIFIAARHRVACYPEVPQALKRLAALLPLASLSNGNADLARIGLDTLIPVRISARSTRLMKPDARIFEHLCRQLGCAPSEVMHVGDDPELDVAGARAAGLQVAWLNREQRRWPGPGPQPQRVFADLDQLADWIEHAVNA